jgi:hypothetical protein
MKSIKNLSIDLKWRYSSSSLILLLTGILVFVFVLESNSLNSKFADLPLQRNSSGITDKGVLKNLASAEVLQENKNIMLTNSKSPLNKTNKSKITQNNTFLNIETDQDHSLQLESWMTENKNFEQTFIWCNDELDEPLNVEEWMISNRHFESYSEISPEKELQVESWMTDGHFWGR